MDKVIIPVVGEWRINP